MMFSYQLALLLSILSYLLQRHLPHIFFQFLQKYWAERFLESLGSVVVCFKSMALYHILWILIFMSVMETTFCSIFILSCSNMIWAVISLLPQLYCAALLLIVTPWSIVISLTCIRVVCRTSSIGVLSLWYRCCLFSPVCTWLFFRFRTLAHLFSFSGNRQLAILLLWLEIQ